MKKYTLAFLSINAILFAFVLFITSFFFSCKDDKDDNNNVYENIFESKSFSVHNLVDSVYGDYTEHNGANFTAGLKCKFAIKNKTDQILKYYVTIERIEMVKEHYMEYCFGGNCRTWKGSSQETIWYSPKGEDPEMPVWQFSPNAITNADSDTYLIFKSGNDNDIPPIPSMPGITKFKITYTNIDDPKDFITFICFCNFNDSHQ